MTIYRPDQKIIELLKKNKFTFSAEVIPPRNGSSQDEIFSQIHHLVGSGAQFLSVTKGAGGSLRGGSLPIAQAIKDHFQRPAIAHFTSRDLTPEEVENQLMDHHYFGIRNILALRGDPPQGDVDWKPKENSYPYAYQLIEQIVKLNGGEFLKRKNFEVKPELATQFCIGAAAYPDDSSYEKRVGYYKRKVDAGAEYGITQMLFDVDSYMRFVDECAACGVTTPVLPGTRILKNRKQAEKMAKRFEVSMPESLLAALPADETKVNADQVLSVFLRFVEQLKAAGAPGLHLFVLSDTELCSHALQNLVNWPL